MTQLTPDRPRAETLFEDGKDASALRTIGEVARALNIKPHVLRYWEEQFPMLQPIKRSGSRRYYRPEDVTLITEIYRLVNLEGYTLRGAANALSARTLVAADPLHPAKTTAVPAPGPDMVQELIQIRQELAEALARA